MDIITNWFINKIKSLSKQERIAIISSLISGFLSHGYAMGNNYIYHDSTILNGLGTTFGLGRWALGFSGELNNLTLGNYQLPLLNIVISLIFIALSSAVVTRFFKVKSYYLSGFIGAVFAAYPVVTSTFAYNFSATYYFLALFLAVLSVDRISDSDDKKDIIIAIILLTFSAGFYQAYLSVAVTMALSLIMKELLLSESEIKDIVRKGIKYIVTFIVSLVLYLILNKISLVIMKPPATGYQGAKNMGALTISKIPARFIQTYLHFFYIKWNGINKQTCMWVFIITYLVIAAVMVIRYMLKKKLPCINVILFVIAYAVMPIAVNLVYLMSTDDKFSIHTLMRFATVFVILTPAVFMEATSSKEKDRGLSICAVLLTVITFCYIYSNNVAYMKMNLVQTEMTSFFTVLESRISQVENFSDETPVVFYGEFKIEDKNLYDMNEMYGDTVILGYEYNARDLINRESWKRYMAYHTGFAPNIIDAPADILETDEFANLKVYPDADSIKVINGILVVKLSDQ